MKRYCVYILATGPDGELDFGVTSNLADLPPRRLASLIWLEEHIDLRGTLRRELQIQRASPEWRRRLIDQTNPDRIDLRDTLVQAQAA